MHGRISVSAISSMGWTLDQDLAFWDDAGIESVGVSFAKLEAAGVELGARRVAGTGRRVSNLIGVGPFRLVDPDQWPAQRDRLRRALDAASTVHAECLVCTTGPGGGLTWEDAADAFADAAGPVLDEARARGLPVAIEHTNSLRPDIGFLHTLRDAIDVATALDVGVCMETNACWGERALGDTIEAGIDRIRLVQVSDFVVGTLSTPDRAVPGDGDIPFRRILRQVLDAGYEGTFDLELIGPRIEEEGYTSAIPRAVDALDALLEELGVT